MRLHPLASAVAFVVLASACSEGPADAPPNDDAGDAATHEDVGSGRAWSATTPLAVARLGHSATALADGRVLVVGGSAGLCPGDATSALASVELLGPDGVSAAAPLQRARMFHAAARLSTGAVLVAGGRSDGITVEVAERYDADADRWSDAGATRAAGPWILLAPLGDGRALAVGWPGADGHAVIDIHDGEAWTPGPELPFDAGPSALAPLADGRVALVGRDSAWLVSADGTELAPMAGAPTLRDAPGAAAFLGASVLVVASHETGDFTEAGPVVGTAAFRWDASGARWETIGATPFDGSKLEAVALPDGRALARSGYGAWHRFDASAGWEALPGYGAAQEGPVVGLSDGALLVVGGAGTPTCKAIADVRRLAPDARRD
ncbi:MAG: hypothetical protein U1F43_10030 [Myxococcota bacterium]